MTNLRARFGGRHPARAQIVDETPLGRAELLSADQMEQYGKTLAESHKLSTGRASDQLLARLAGNEVELLKATTF